MTTNTSNAAAQQQFNYVQDLFQALLWQYDDATNLKAIIQYMQDVFNTNQTQFWSDWYDNVFNLLTANEFGCAVWAIILGIPLNIIQAPSTAIPWGFGVFNKNFGNGNFATTGGEIVGLTLEEQRLILRLRYFQLTCNGTVLEINAFLKLLFEDFGQVYVLDGLDMTCIYVFKFNPSTGLLLALQDLDLLPRPAGVKLTIEIATGGMFGFGPNWQNFNNGTFGA